MATLGAFFDANVLSPSGLRNFLMHLALTGIFRALCLPKSTTNGYAIFLRIGLTLHETNWNALDASWTRQRRTRL